MPLTLARRLGFPPGVYRATFVGEATSGIDGPFAVAKRRLVRHIAACFLIHAAVDGGVSASRRGSVTACRLHACM
jgi:hypothetical protein